MTERIAPKTLAAAAALLAALAIQCLVAMKTASLTSDEFSHHIASGHSYAVTRDFRMNPASPPLPRLLSGIALAAAGAKAPLEHPSWAEGNSPAYAKEFFYRANPGRLDDFALLARLPILFLSLFLGFSLFLWVRRFFGDVSALAALLLYAFSPDVVAHSSLATADLAVALFFFLAVARFGEYLGAPTWRNLFLTALFAGGALLSKFSAVVLFPVLVLVTAVAGLWRPVRPSRTLAFLAITLFVVWAGYAFEVKPLLKNTPDPPKKIAALAKAGGAGLVRIASDVPLPATTFVSAVISMGYTRAQGTNAFLLGEWSRTGWWYYYFVAFAVKNTIPFLLLLLAGIASARRIVPDRLAAAVLFAPPLFFFIATMPDRAQAGIRYFLPVYPMLLALSGAAAGAAIAKKRWRAAIAGGLLLWHAAEGASMLGHPLAYFNQLAGGPAGGYKVLRDSNVDWGQGLKGLGELAQEKGYPEVALFFYGPVDPAYYKIPHRKLEPDEFEAPRRAVYAIGAHRIDEVRWTRNLRPTTTVGYSIYVYDLRQ